LIAAAKVFMFSGCPKHKRQPEKVSLQSTKAQETNSLNSPPTNWGRNNNWNNKRQPEYKKFRFQAASSCVLCFFSSRAKRTKQ
jgi:hypothetical protein